MDVERVWTNSAYGRFLCSSFGPVLLLVILGTAVEGDTSVDAGFVLRSAGVMLVALVVAVAAWTSRLELASGVLTATNLGISRSMLLRDVVDVDPSAFPFFGMKIRRADKSGIRTLVSGRAWNESYTTRAERICREIAELAAESRHETAASS